MIHFFMNLLVSSKNFTVSIGHLAILLNAGLLARTFLYFPEERPVDHLRLVCTVAGP